MKQLFTRYSRLLSMFLALTVTAALWLPCLHLLFRPQLADWFPATVREPVPPRAHQLAAWHLRFWQDPALRQHELRKMRASNVEWDFMGRTYLVLALANMAIREPAQASRHLEVMDTIITETLRLEQEHGIYFFLMDYAHASRWIASPPRSVFEDGEIALMLAARCLVAAQPEFRQELRTRTALMEKQMRQSPVLCAESYPDECWMFCNSIAVSAMRLQDALEETRDHEGFIRDWLAVVKAKLTDPATGLLVSSFTTDGMVGDGPEGSSIWMIAHCLALVDAEFAADQYRRARRELGCSLWGFGYAWEWPRSTTETDHADIDSGPIVPILEISAGSSGLAFLGAATFGDRAYLNRLLTSLCYGGFPEARDGRLRFNASNQVGDAVLLYAMVQGPLWVEARRRYEAKSADERSKI